MDVLHCGTRLAAIVDREIKTTPEEAARGVIKVYGRKYTCNKPDCKRSLYYKREEFEVGLNGWQRVKKNIASFSRRLQYARQSDWVWSYDRITFAKVKWTCR